MYSLSSTDRISMLSLSNNSSLFLFLVTKSSWYCFLLLCSSLNSSNVLEVREYISASLLTSSKYPANLEYAVCLLPSKSAFNLDISSNSKSLQHNPNVNDRTNWSLPSVVKSQDTIAPKVCLKVVVNGPQFLKLKKKTNLI